MKKIKLLFQGDSITDWGRGADSRDGGRNLGTGYALRAAENLRKKYPDVEFEFINMGISGNQTVDLVNRLQSDFIDVDPDIVSIMIGINDVWHYANNGDRLDDNVFEERYRTVLTAIKEKTHAKIMMIEPYLIPVEDKLHFFEDFNSKIWVIRRLAREFADIYMPTDGLMASALIHNDPVRLSEDGVHPTADKGAVLIGQWYTEYIAPLVESFR